VKKRRICPTIVYGNLSEFTPFKKELFWSANARFKKSRNGNCAWWGTLELMGQLKKTVVIVGMMGAGKTAVGTALAKILAVPFIDSDDEIISAANRSIAEIFERDGEQFFRSRETEVLARLLRGTPCILSTGGGAFLAQGNRNLIKEAGLSVWLRADADLLWQRVRHKTTRPLLRTPNPRETLLSLTAARDPVYSKADIIVESEADLSVDQMAQRVLQALAKRPDALNGMIS
jgi:shikimate kinase